MATLTKQQTIKLFKKLYVPAARSHKNWREMLDSLLSTEDITKGQSKYRYWDYKKEWKVGA